MINTQQLIALMPLFKVKLPANALMIFEKIMEIAAFDIYEFDEPLNKLLDVEPTQPYREGFDTVGFESIYLLNNLDALNLAYLAWFILVFTVFILKFLVQESETSEKIR